MSDEVQEAQPANGGCFYALPTRTQRFWRWVGFRFHLGDEPEGAETMPGWMQTKAHFQFGIADRIRLLLTGRITVTLSTHIDTPSPDVCKTRLDWLIHAPGDKWR
jgi:hypothetical protein